MQGVFQKCVYLYVAGKENEECTFVESWDVRQEWCSSLEADTYREKKETGLYKNQADLVSACAYIPLSF